MDTQSVSPLLATLARELERPRKLPAQVIAHLSGTYGVDRNAIGQFLVNELPKLEDYEIDLALSPVFTPTLPDQAVLAELLGRDSVPVEQWPELVRQLVERPTCAQLITEDDRTHMVNLRNVSVERYVHRLRLDATISEPLLQLINQMEPATDRSLLKAIARRAVWQSDNRHDIFVRYLNRAVERKAYQLEDAAGLLKLVEIYQPLDATELLARIPHWQQVLRQEINEATGAKPFFNERVEELHGGGRDQRRQNQAGVTAKESEQAFLGRLQRVLTD